MTEEPDLPAGWVWTTVGELATFIGSGITPLGGQNVYGRAGVPFIRSQNVYSDGLHLSDVVYVSPKMHAEMKRTHVKPDDVLLNITGASIGRSTYVPHDLGEANVNQHVCIIRTGPWIVPAYLSWFLNSPLGQQQIFATESGVTRQGLNYGQLRRFKIPLAPLKEQNRIARIIEKLMAQNRGAQIRLEKARSILRQFRKALLAKAFHGALTERDPNDEPAGKLLERVRQERRKRWEDELRAKGRDPTKHKYAEPTCDDGSDAEIREDWVRTHLGFLVILRNGKALPKAKRDVKGAIPVYGGNGFIGNHSKSLVDFATIVLGRVGANCGNVHLTPGASWVTDNAIYAAWISRCVNPTYLLHFLRYRNLNALSGGTGQPYVSQELLYPIVVPLPSLGEQKRMVVLLEGVFERQNAVENGAKRGTEEASVLQQSILLRAFRGELLSQDPNDEPASVLLERVRTQRVMGKKTVRRKLEEFASTEAITAKA
jgi:type I restriction enzyme S subunit